MIKKLLLVLVLLVMFCSFTYAADSKLIIRDLTIVLDSERQRSLRNGDTFNEIIEPGDDINFEFEIENEFRDNTDIDNIQITVTINNITDNENIVEKKTKFDLSDGKTKTKRIKVDIPSDANELITPAYIHIKGIDDNGDIQEINWTIFLNINDEDHDIIFYNTKINQTLIDCSGTALITVWLDNIGKYDESKAALTVENQELGIFQSFTNLDINSDEKYSKLVYINVSEASKTGKYDIKLKSYYKNTHLDDVTIVPIDVIACKKEFSQIKKDEEPVKEDIVAPKEDSKPVTQIDIKENIQDRAKDAVEALKTQENAQKKEIPVVFFVILILLVVILIIVIVSIYILKN